MTFGCEVKNATGNVVIDTTYQNLSLAKVQDFSVSAGGTFTVTHTSGVAPMMAINASDYVGFYGATVSGSTYTWKFKAASAASGTVYVFDKAHAPHTSSFGMKVLAADGVTEMFNSDNKYLRVVDVLPISWSSTWSRPVYINTITGPTASNTSLASAKYAVCMSLSRVATVGVNNNNYQRIFDGVKTTSTGVYVSQTIPITFFAGTGGDHPGLFDYTGDSSGTTTGTIYALIVNVEGY